VQGAAHLRSYRQRNKELSTDAHARLISGKTPQKHMVWQVRYFSCTMAGSSGMSGDTGRMRDGHWEEVQHNRQQHIVRGPPATMEISRPGAATVLHQVVTSPTSCESMECTNCLTMQ